MRTNLDTSPTALIHQKDTLKKGHRKSIEDLRTIKRGNIQQNVNTPTLYELMHNTIELGQGDNRMSNIITASDLPEGWLDIMLKVGRSGLGVNSIMKELNITKSEFETLLTTSPEFSEAYERTQILCADTMEKIAFNMCVGDIKGSSEALKLIMCNRFGWTTANKTQEVTTTATVQNNTTISNKELTESELQKELEKRGINIDAVFKKSYD